MNFDFAANAPKKVPRPSGGLRPTRLTAEDILPDTEAVELSPEDLEDDVEAGVDVDLSALESPQEKLKKIENAEKPPGFALESIKGEKYETKEDQGYYDAQRKILAVFDGMGGVAGGDAAAQAAAAVLLPESIESIQDERIQKLFGDQERVDMTEQEAEQAMSSLLERANQGVVEAVRNDPKIIAKAEERAAKDLMKFVQMAGDDPAKRTAIAMRMLGAEAADMSSEDQFKKMLDVVRERYIESIGTTASVMKSWKNPEGRQKITIGHVGDSRIYSYGQDGKLERLTRDNSFVQALQDIGMKIDDQDLESTIQVQAARSAIDAYRAAHPSPTADEQVILKSAEAFIASHHDEETVKVGDIRNKMLMNVGGSKATEKTYGIGFRPQVRTMDAKQGAWIIEMSDGGCDNLPEPFIKFLLDRYKGDLKEAVGKLTEVARLVARAKLDPEVIKLKTDKGSERDVEAKTAEVIKREMYAATKIRLDDATAMVLAQWSKDDDITIGGMEM